MSDFEEALDTSGKDVKLNGVLIVKAGVKVEQNG